MRLHVALIVLGSLLIGLAPDGNGQESADRPSESADASDTLELIEKTQQALKVSDFSSAKRYAALLLESTDSARFRLVAADALLRCGEAKQAVTLFDQYIKERPRDKPYLWQRGIALYFTGEFEKGAEQFEVHRRVNPNDVENAAWHFLCVAKDQSPDAAKGMLLPAPDDAREPMEQVLAMFRSGNTQAVIDRMNSFPESSAKAKSARFYGNFYLGLYADATGQDKDAIRYLEESVRDAPANYMGDVARVYVRHLKK